VESLVAGPAFGPNVESASLAEVLAAANELGSGLDWRVAAPRLLPMFERVRPYPPGTPEPLRVVVPPGLTVGLGIDIGRAFITVGQGLIADWPVSLADATAQALANVLERATELQPSDIHRDQLDGRPTGWLQTDRSVGSLLVLAPTELSRLYGAEPRLFIAPMRDLIIGLPPHEFELGAWLFAEIAAEDPNHLRPLAFNFDGERISVSGLLPGTAAQSHQAGRDPLHA
jgi:hypothetical protein